MQIKIYSNVNKELLDKVLNLTKPICDTYSSHDDWFKSKFVPNIQKGERIYIVSFDDNENLTGCSLLKDTKQEKKICTLFVNPKYRKQGIASVLLDASLNVLNNKAVMTVADKNLSQLLSLIKKYNFELTSVKKDVYTKGSVEYFFNEKKPSVPIISANELPLELAKLQQKYR